MSDIFDEVDDILGDVEADTTESDTANSPEMNFNESELQDIMAEIENLEKDFATEPVGVLKAVVAPVQTEKPTDLQSEIDREIEMTMETKEKITAPVEVAPKVLSFEKKSQVSNTLPTTSGSNSEISFEAHGQMNLNLGFKIGEESARLTIDPVKGLVITMSGVELCINQETGCKVTMDSGVKFTIPLTSPETALKKKSA